MSAHDLIELQLHFESGQIERQRVSLPVLIGRGDDCTLRLTGWRVGKHHARLSAQGEEIFVEDLGTLLGTTVNGLRVATYGPLHTDDAIVIGACRLRILMHGRNAGPAPAPADPGVRRQSGPSTPDEASFTMPPAIASGAGAASAPRVVERGGEPSLAPGAEPGGALHPAWHTQALGGHAPPRLGEPDPAPGLPLRLEAAQRAGLDAAGLRSDSARASVHGTSIPSAAPAAKHDDAAFNGSRQLRRRLHLALLERLDLRRRDVSGMSDAALRQQAAQLLRELISEARSELDADVDPAALAQDVLDEALGLGPLEALLADPEVTEIMVNRHDCIYIESHGRLTRHGVAFSGEAAVRGVLERIVAPLGRRVDESSPMVDARLPDGSRVNAVIPPVALGGAVITIRKFPQRHWQMADLLAAQALSESMADYLTHAVHHRRSIIVSGGTGAGKTTLLNVLSDAIPEGERVITIEDAAELRLAHAHRVALEARPSNAEGRGRVEIRDLVRNALRMRPDRIVVGECRGAEAFDMLTAMNTGHEGSLTTLHANSPRDALGRLESMVLMAGLDLPLSVVREYVASSIDLVVQQSRLSSGRRVVTQIVEVTGMESGCVQTQTLFAFDARQGFVETDALAMTPADWRGAQRLAAACAHAREA